MKRFVCLMFLAAVTFHLSANGQQDQRELKDGEKVKITFWDQNPGPNRTPYLQEIIRNFEAQSDWVEVKYVGIPWKSAEEKYNVAVLSDTVPDVAGMPFWWISSFSTKDTLLPLDDLFNSWDEKDQFIASQIGAIKDTAIDGKLYQIPNSANIEVLWYRPDVFEEKGVTVGGDWDDFFSNVAKLTDKDKEFYGFSIRGGAGSHYQIQTALYSYSGIDHYFDEDGNCTINDPKHVEFLERFIGMYKKYTPVSDISNAYKEMIAVFDSGSAAMIHHNLGSHKEHTKSLEAGQFAATPLPRSVNGNYTNINSGTTGYTIFKTTELRQKAAWEFVKFLCSEDTMSFWNETIGQMPTRRDVFEHEWLKNAQHIKVASDLLADEETVLVTPPAQMPGYSSIHGNLLRPGFQELMLGNKTAQAYLDEWAEAMEKEYAEYQAAFR